MDLLSYFKAVADVEGHGFFSWLVSNPRLKIFAASGLAIPEMFGWVRLNNVLVLLAIVCIADFILGISASFANGEAWDSKRANAGLFRKLVIMIGVSTLYFLAKNTPTEVPSIAMSGDCIGFAFTLSQVISVLKNMARAGVDMPPPITRFLLNYEKKD